MKLKREVIIYPNRRLDRAFKMGIAMMAGLTLSVAINCYQHGLGTVQNSNDELGPCLVHDTLPEFAAEPQGDNQCYPTNKQAVTTANEDNMNFSKRSARPARFSSGGLYALKDEEQETWVEFIRELAR